MSNQYNTTIDQGATWVRTITWKGPDSSLVRDLTGYTGRMSLKSGGVTAISLTTENGRMTIGGADGTIGLEIAYTDTETLAPGTYKYDLELMSGDSPAFVTRLLQGHITVIPNTTT